MKALLAAWAISLIILVGGVLALEMASTPPDPATSGGGQADQSATGESETPPRRDDDPAPDPTDNRAENGGDNEGSGEGNGAAPETESLDGNDTESGTSAPDEAGARSAIDAVPARQDTDPEAPEGPAFTDTAPRVEPDPALLEETSNGPLPKVGRDGRMPAEVYAAAHPVNDERPRIAIIMTDMGMRARSTRRALDSLPTQVSLAFSPYGAELDKWGRRAREKGFETLLMVPMEPVNYPQNDPGPLSLLVKHMPSRNISLLHSAMGRMTGYVGIINHMGSRFTADSDSLRPVLGEIKNRGLIFVDSRASQYSRGAKMGQAMGLAVAINNRYIDNDLVAEEIALQLGQLENRARTLGAAVGVARPYPVSLEAIRRWREDLYERGFVLAPVTAVVGRQPIR
ncbi:divergent polysaccharide deacetylase family protein [Yunchengibacter salinarum]|uniref:divergent polysaccharide deacetylase family protein n=1 Tax=Yunchengibacter salinarum TaxID=3133399 RepID=UPI0035B5E732